MSYDIYISVKVAGAENLYATIAEPEYHSPTYNLGKMFRACMNWDYSQSEKDENGEYKTCYYRCDEVINYVEHGLRELRTNRMEYEQYNPENGWGSLDGAIKCLESVRACIYEQAERIPIECLYMSW